MGGAAFGCLRGVVAGAGAAFPVPPTGGAGTVLPWAASSLPACSSVCSTFCCTCAGTFEPPIDAPLASGS